MENIERRMENGEHLQRIRCTSYLVRLTWASGFWDTDHLVILEMCHLDLLGRKGCGWYVVTAAAFWICMENA